MAYSRSSFRRAYSRSSYSRRGASSLRKFSSRTTKQGRDTATQTCKTSVDIVLNAYHPAVSGKSSVCFGWVNMWKLLSGSSYGPILSKLYDEVRLDSVKLDFVFKSADGLVSTSPAYIVAFAWDRNGISTSEVGSDGVPKALPSDYSSVVQRNGNFYQAFKYSTSVYASSMAEKSQYVPASALADYNSSGVGDMLKYLTTVNSTYYNGGSYVFRPTILVSLRVPTVAITSAVFSVTASFNVTCRGIRMLATGPFNLPDGSFATENDVRLGKSYYNDAGNIETGTLVTLSPQQIVVSQLGGDIQIGTPGVFYDGSTVVHFEDTPDNPLTYNISHYSVGTDRVYLASSFSDSIFSYEFDSQLGEYIAHCNVPGNYLFYVPYSVQGETIYILWYWRCSSEDVGEIDLTMFNYLLNGKLLVCKRGRRKMYYGVKLDGDEILPNCTSIIPYLEGGAALPFIRTNGKALQTLTCFSDHVLLPPEENV